VTEARSVRAMSRPRDADTILVEWRSVEREIQSIRRSGDVALLQAGLTALHEEARRLRSDYQRLIRGR
jgi:hypothetical protein